MRTSTSWLVVVVVAFAVGAFGCTKPNPRSCADGLCSDPSRPFCDVDGALEGTPEVCVPVSCTQGEFIACRDDEVIRCNASGNNYDLLACQRGCSEAEGGCISCSVDAECANPAPICDTMAHDCRGCRSDAECPSKVCAIESGTCLAETEVVYASPSGGAASACSLGDPCSMARAVTVVTTSALPRTLRMLPGTYNDPVTIQGAVVVNVVATGAELGTLSGMFVRGGAVAEFRGLAVRTGDELGGDAIICGETTASIPKSSLTFRNSVLAVTTIGAVVSGARCNLRIETSEISAQSYAISLGTDSTFEGDRLHIHGKASFSKPFVIVSGVRVAARLTNSLLENTAFIVSTADTTAPGSPVYAAFNTFVFTMQDGAQACEYTTSYVRDVKFENNVFYATASANVTLGDWRQCGLSNNVLFPQAEARIGNIVADPKFVDLAAKNYALQATSPAVDAAVPSTGLSTIHDYLGAARPQGAAPDIGAFERTP